MPRLARFVSRLLGVVTAVVFVLLSASDAAADASFIYALRQVNGGGNQIFGFRINSLNVGLAPLPGFPIATGGNGTFAAAAEMLAYGGGRLFAMNDGSDTMSVYAVNQATGALTPLPFSPFALGTAVSDATVAVHPSGSPVVIGNSTAGFLRSFVVTSTTITEAAGSPYFMGGANPFSLQFSRDGNFVYSGGNVGSAIAGFSVSASTGVLTALPGSPFASGTLSPASYATDAAGRLFVASLQSVTDVNVFTTAGGVPTAVSGNPFPAAGLNQPVRGVLHPAGFYIVAARNSARVGVFQISGSGSATTLAAVAGSPFNPGGSNTNTLALTPDGSLLVAGNGGSRNLTAFRVNPSTGNLTVLLLQAANSLGATGLVTGLVLVPQVSAFGDVNGDEKGDLLLRNRSSGQNIGWLMNGTVVSVSAFLPTIADTNWEVRGMGDFDSDGKADVILRNRSTGQNIGWLMNGLTVGVSAFLPTIASTNWQIQGVGDFNGDGKGDVIWRNRSTGQNIGWLMNGLTVSVSAFLPTIADTNWEIRGVGDFDGNGTADVILRNRSTGQNIGWLMNGLAVSVSAFLPTIADTNWDIKGAGDFNGDTRADVILRNRSTGQNIGWLMNGLVVSVSAFLPTIADTNWEIKNTGDASADRKADVAWRNRSTGQNIMWLMNGLSVSAAAFMPTIADTNWTFVGGVSQ